MALFLYFKETKNLSKKTHREKSEMSMVEISLFNIAFFAQQRYHTFYTMHDSEWIVNSRYFQYKFLLMYRE